MADPSLHDMNMRLKLFSLSNIVKSISGPIRKAYNWVLPSAGILYQRNTKLSILHRLFTADEIIIVLVNRKRKSLLLTQYENKKNNDIAWPLQFAWWNMKVVVGKTWNNPNCRYLFSKIKPMKWVHHVQSALIW